MVEEEMRKVEKGGTRGRKKAPREMGERQVGK